MTRLPVSGASVVLPEKSEADLRSALAELGVGDVFPSESISELYFHLGAIIGNWSSEQSRLEVLPVAKTLLSMASDLGKASALLSGHQTGLRDEFEIAMTNRVVEILVLDPAIGSLPNAHDWLDRFQRDVDRIAQVCLIAHAALPNEGRKGRAVLGWYDEFTALLLKIALAGNVAPSLRTNRITGFREGWLFQAAQLLETFLHLHMRSPSPEACGKRLERSLKRLRPLHRQNTPGN